jgi:cytoskeletal protein CcmA (bactofilin family)
MATIGKSITFKGDLSGNEDLVIEGVVEGTVSLPSGQLTVGAEGKLRAEIKAKSVVVVGRVTGNVSATDRVEVQSTGVVEGDVRAPRLIVQEGAVINGAVEMTREGASATGAVAVAGAPPAPPRKAAGQL